MKYYLRAVLVALAALYLHHAALPRLLTADFTPDLTIATAVYFALAAGGAGAVVIGFLMGLAGDLFGWGPLGLGAGVTTLAAAGYGRLRVQIYQGSLLVPAVLTTFAVLVKQALALLFLAIGPAGVALTWGAVGRLGLHLLITALVCFPLYFFYWRFIPPRRY